MKIENNIRLLIAVLGIIVCTIAYYGEITWRGEGLSYPKDVLASPAVVDPMNILTSQDKENIEKKLACLWESQRIAVYIIIQENIDLKTFDFFLWHHKIPYYRSKAVLFTKDIESHQWCSYLCTIEKRGPRGRIKYYNHVRSLDKIGIEIPSASITFTRICEIIADQDKSTDNRDRTNIINFWGIIAGVLIFIMFIILPIVIIFAPSWLKGVKS